MTQFVSATMVTVSAWVNDWQHISVIIIFALVCLLVTAWCCFVWTSLVSDGGGIQKWMYAILIAMHNALCSPTDHLSGHEYNTQFLLCQWPLRCNVRHHTSSAILRGVGHFFEDTHYNLPSAWSAWFETVFI